MADKRINHFDTGPLGKFTGHSIVHDNGTIDHYENGGSLADGVTGGRWVGRSVMGDNGALVRYGPGILDGPIGVSKFPGGTHKERASGDGGNSGGLVVFLFGIAFFPTFFLLLGCLAWGKLTGTDGLRDYFTILLWVRDFIVQMFIHAPAVIWNSCCLAGTGVLLWRFKLAFPIFLVVFNILLYSHIQGQLSASALFVFFVRVDLEWGLSLGVLYGIYRICVGSK